MFEKEIILREQLRHGASSSVTRPKIAGQTVARWIVEALPVIHPVRPPRVANGLSVRCFTHPLTTLHSEYLAKRGRADSHPSWRWHKTTPTERHRACTRTVGRLQAEKEAPERNKRGVNMALTRDFRET